MRKAILPPLLLLLLLLPGGGAVPGVARGEEAAPAELTGRTVTAILWESPIPFREEEFSPLLSLRVGEPLSPESVRGSLAALFRTGRVAQAGISGRADGEGVEVLIRISPRRVLGRISLQGNLLIPDSSLFRKIPFRPGQGVDEEAVREAGQRLAEYCVLRGFPDASVTSEFRDTSFGETDLLFRVKEGPRLRLGDARLEGWAGMSRTRLLALMGSRLGDPCDGEKLEEDAAALQRHLRGEGWSFAEVDLVLDRSRPAVGGVAVFQVKAGERHLLLLAGGTHLDADDAEEVLKGGFASEVEPARALSTAEAAVRERYLASGFPFFRGSWEERPIAGGREHLLRVEEGPQVRWRRMSIEGAVSLGEGEAEKALGIQPGTPFHLAAVEEGLSRLARIYRSRGFLSPVFSLQPPSFSGGEGGEPMEAELLLRVNEGMGTRVSGLSLSIADPAPSQVPEEEIRRLLGVAAGGPYDPDALARGRDALLGRLEEEGYLYAQFTSGETFTPGKAEVVLTARVEAGPRVLMGNLLISGNRSTEGSILRRVADLPRGEPLSWDRILEGQKQLYQLGVLEAADMSLVAPSQAAAVKDVQLTVRERRRMAVEIEAGYSTEEKFNGEVSFTHRNVGGKARSLQVKGRAGDLGSLATVGYTVPWFLDRPLDLTLALTDQIDQRVSYSRDATTASVLLQRRFSDRSVATFGYSYQGLRLFDVSPDAQLSEEDAGHTTIGSFSSGYLYDGRDDPFDPRSGFVADVSLEWAASFFGSEAEFYRLEGAYKRYLPLGSGLVAALRAQGGVVEAYGASSEVLISRRFFLGGQNTVRGYALDTLGPVDSAGDPLGGNYLVNLDAELRFPLYRFLRGVAFVDSGSIWLGSGEYNRFDLRSSAGVGLRWSTPIGPLSLDYGVKLNPATDAEDDTYLHFSIGHAF